MKIFVSKIVFALSLCRLYGTETEIEGFVTPTVNYYEHFSNLPKEKLTQSHLSEIENLLEKKAEKIRIVTYNMLFDWYDHNRKVENRWPSRLPRIVTLINQIDPDIICTQELMDNQAAEISELLSKKYAFFAGQKDYGREHWCIFYKKDRFTLIEDRSTYPLSVAHLKDNKTQKEFFVLNTHLSFGKPEMRNDQVRKIVMISSALAQEGPVVFTGDLNTFPARFDMGDLPYFDGDYLHRKLEKEGSLKDSNRRSVLGHFGPISTFTNDPSDFQKGCPPFQGTGTPGITLDYIYVSDHFSVLAHATESARVGGHFPSDHQPVLADLIIN